MKMTLNINHIQAERENGKDLERDTSVEYPMDLYIQGVKQGESNSASVSFKLQTISSPEIANFTLSGELIMIGTEEEIEAWTMSSKEGPPKVWKHIYQESMNIMTVLAKVIDVPFPTPKVGEITVGH